MKTLLKLFSVLLLSTIVNASTNWVPIMMGDIMTFIPQGNAIKTTQEVYPASLYLGTSAPTVKVNIEGPLSGDQDWVGIFRVGSASTWANTLAWTWVDGNKNNLDITTIKDDKGFLFGGKYEVRLFFHNSVHVEATYPFYMLQPGRPVLLVDDPFHAPNDIVSVLINTERLTGNKDWVAIYHADDASTWENVVAWNWAENGGATLDKIKQQMPAGDYEIRLFFNNSYQVEAQTNFTVEGENRVYPPETTLTPRATDFNVAPPQVDAPIIDTVFHTRIHKVDKVGSDWSPYPKVQAWNKDETLLRINSRLYDAETLKETDITRGKSDTQAYNTLCSRNSDYFRWSNLHSNIFYVINSDNKFLEGEIIGNTVNCSEVLDDFNEYEEVHMGPNEGNIDYADKYVVFVAKKPNDTRFYVILYNIFTHSRVWTKEMTSQTWEWRTHNGSSFWAPSTLDWISVSPSGNHIVFNNDNGNRDGVYRYDMNLNNKTKLQYRYDGNGQLYSPHGHGDIGFDTDGNEVFVQFVAGVGVYSFNLDNPTELGKKLLDSPYGGGHISCRNTNRPGWCYVATMQENYQRVFSLKLDGTANETVENFTQTYLPGGAYTYGNVSPSGTQVIFNSTWSNTAQGVHDTYIAESENN